MRLLPASTMTARGKLTDRTSLGALSPSPVWDKHAMPSDGYSISQGPQWVPSPVSPVPLRERAAANQAAAGVASQEISRQKLREAFMKALVDLGDTSRGAQIYVALRVWRSVVWHLWRTGRLEERQAARLILKMLKTGKRGRPTTEHKRTKIALQVEDEIGRQRKEAKRKRINKEHVYGIVAAQIGKKPEYVKGAYLAFKNNLSEAAAKVRTAEAKAEVLKAKAEARARASEEKVQANSAFYRGAAKWK